MKHVIRILLALLVAGLFVVALSLSAVDITKSTNYKTYELKYLVNLTGVDTAKQDSTINDLQNVFNSRIHKFAVANLKIEKESKDNNWYLNVKFGTIDDISAIKKAVELNDTLIIKEKISIPAAETKTEETISAEASSTETTNASPNETSNETPVVEAYKTEVEAKANEALKKMLAGESFEITAQNQILDDPLRTAFSQAGWMYKDEIKDVFAQKLFDMQPGTVYNELIKYQERPFTLSAPIDVIAIIKLYEKEEIDRKTSTPKQVEVSHILISYKDAMRAAETTTRTKDEARTLADEIKNRLNNGEDFTALAKEYSDDTTNKNAGGALNIPAGNKSFVEQFENASLALETEGQISDVVESPFGFHIIKAGKITAATEESHKETRVKFGVLFFAQQPSEWQDTDLTRKNLAGVDVIYTKEYDPYIVMNFNDEGKKLLKDLTEKNMNNILGIFVGRELITSFTVQEINDKGVIKILRPGSTKEADALKEKLLQTALPAPVILMDEKDTTPAK